MQNEFQKLFFILGETYKKKLFLVFLTMLTIATFEVLSIGVMLPFLKIVMDIRNNSYNSYLHHFKNHLNLNDNEVITLIGLIIIFIFLSKNIAHYLINKYQAKVLHQTKVNVSKRMYTTYLNMNYMKFVDKTLSEIMHNATGQVSIFVMVFMQSILLVASEVIVVLFLLILLLFVNPQIILTLSLIGLLVTTLVTKIFKKSFKEIGVTQNEANLKMIKATHEGINAFKEIRVLQVNKFFTNAFDEAAFLYKNMATKKSSISIIPKLFFEFIFIASLICAILLSILLDYDLEKQIPVFILFTISFVKIFPSINRIVTYNNQIHSSKVSFDTLYNELSTIKETSTSSNTPNNFTMKFEKSISIKNINFSYNKNSKIFTNFSMEIPKNKTIAIIGKSGSGKTTIIDLILGLLTPTTGEIRLDNSNIHDNISKWYEKVSYIPQEVSFVDDSIKNNIAFGQKEIDEARIKTAVRDSQLELLIKGLPNGLDTKIGDRGVKLSGGQRQRIGIARALYKNPEVLIFDEATSALDIETERAVTESIEKLNHSKTIIIVAHRISTIKNSDIIFILENGKVQDKGTYQELLQKNKWFKSLNS